MMRDSVLYDQLQGHVLVFLSSMWIPEKLLSQNKF